VVQTECVTDQPVMGLDTIHLRDLVLAYPALHQGYLGNILRRVSSPRGAAPALSPVRSGGPQLSREVTRRKECALFFLYTLGK